jgi:hypothetical protein
MTCLNDPTGRWRIDIDGKVGLYKHLSFKKVFFRINP